MAQPSRKTVVKKLDRAFSLWVRARDQGRCVLCGTDQNPTCGHVFSRVAYSTRWEPDNAFCQCIGCNLRHEHDPYPYYRYAEVRLGVDRFDELHRQFSKPKKFTTAELAEMVDQFQVDLDRL